MDIGKAVLEAVREAQKPFFNHEDFSGSGWGIHLPKVSFAGFAPFYKRVETFTYVTTKKEDPFSIIGFTFGYGDTPRIRTGVRNTEEHGLVNYIEPVNPNGNPGQASLRVWSSNQNNGVLWPTLRDGVPHELIYLRKNGWRITADSQDFEELRSDNPINATKEFLAKYIQTPEEILEHFASQPNIT